MDATPTVPPYVVVARPGPGLATIADRRDGTTRLWSRSFRRGQGRHSRHGRSIGCANCGRAIVGPFYHPPQRIPHIADLPVRALRRGRVDGGFVRGQPTLTIIGVP